MNLGRQSSKVKLWPLKKLEFDLELEKILIGAYSNQEYRTIIRDGQTSDIRDVGAPWGISVTHTDAVYEHDIRALSWLWLIDYDSS